MQPEGLASPPSLPLSTPGFSTGTEGGTLGIHTRANPKVIGVSYQSVGRSWGPGWLGTNSEHFPFSYPAQKVLDTDHTASQAPLGIQQAVTTAEASSTTHDLCTSSPPPHLAPNPALWLLLPSETLVIKLLSQALLSGGTQAERALPKAFA